MSTARAGAQRPAGQGAELDSPHGGGEDVGPGVPSSGARPGVHQPRPPPLLPALGGCSLAGGSLPRRPSVRPASPTTLLRTYSEQHPGCAGLGHAGANDLP